MGQYITFFILLRLCAFISVMTITRQSFFFSAINSGALLSTLERCVSVFLLFNVSTFPLKNNFCCCYSFSFYFTRFLWHWNGRRCFVYAILNTNFMLITYNYFVIPFMTLQTKRLTTLDWMIWLILSPVLSTPRALNLNQYLLLCTFCSSSRLLLHLK